jgi:hypothetical protein
MLRQDVEVFKQELLNAQKAQSGDSPYAPDRATIDQKKVHGNPGERDWAEVKQSTVNSRQPLVRYQVKKLDII